MIESRSGTGKADIVVRISGGDVQNQVYVQGQMVFDDVGKNLSRQAGALNIGGTTRTGILRKRRTRERELRGEHRERNEQWGWQQRVMNRTRVFGMY